MYFPRKISQFHFHVFPCKLAQIQNNCQGQMLQGLHIVYHTPTQHQLRGYTDYLDPLIYLDLILLLSPGEDDDNEACQKFYSDGLTNSFTKILTDTAINGWMSDIQVSKTYSRSFKFSVWRESSRGFHGMIVCKY